MITWGTDAYLDRLEELFDLDLAAADALLVAALGETFRWQGREYDTRAMLAGRLVERVAVARWKTRGCLEAELHGAIPEEIT